MNSRVRRLAIVGGVLLIAAHPTFGQSVGVGVGYSTPGGALLTGASGGHVESVTVSSSNAGHTTRWRTGFAVTTFGPPRDAERSGSVRVYALTPAVVFGPGAGNLPVYFSFGPGLYGYRTYRAYRLGWHASAGIEHRLASFTLFSEITNSLFAAHDRDGEVRGARTTAVSIGVRR